MIVEKIACGPVVRRTGKTKTIIVRLAAGKSYPKFLTVQSIEIIVGRYDARRPVERAKRKTTTRWRKTRTIRCLLGAARIFFRRRGQSGSRTRGNCRTTAVSRRRDFNAEVTAAGLPTACVCRSARAATRDYALPRRTITFTGVTWPPIVFTDIISFFFFLLFRYTRGGWTAPAREVQKKPPSVYWVTCILTIVLLLSGCSLLSGQNNLKGFIRIKVKDNLEGFILIKID